MDLFVSNDTEPNKLYRNNHDGTFTDVGVTVGVAFSDSGRVRAGMGADAADFDGSGFPSLVIGNFTNESMSLYKNDGSGLFTDESPRSGIAQMTTQSLTFGCFFMDYDLDGLLDIVAANGHVSDDIAVVQPTLKYAQPAGIYRNIGNRKFEDVPAKLGRAIQKPVVARGMAYADFDNDGDLDLVITANNGPARLLRNDNANQNDVLRVKLIGTKSNRDAIGAKVTLTTSTGVLGTHGEGRIELPIPERTAANLWLGEARKQQNCSHANCLAKWAEGFDRRPEAEPVRHDPGRKGNCIRCPNPLHSRNCREKFV